MDSKAKHSNNLMIEDALAGEMSKPYTVYEVQIESMFSVSDARKLKAQINQMLDLLGVNKRAEIVKVEIDDTQILYRRIIE